MAEKKNAERKLISFANPAVKSALDDFEGNASALVEALIANHFHIELDSEDPSQAERVAYLNDIESANDSVQSEPQGTAAELLELPELPADSANGLTAFLPSQPTDIVAEQSEVIPEGSTKEFEPVTESDFDDIAKPMPMSNDFADLAGEPQDTFTEADPVPAEPTEPTEPANTETVTPAFVPNQKPVDSISAPEANPAEETDSGFKKCPQCSREVILDTCLNCGHNFK